MSIEDNKRIARWHFEELWTNGDLGVADEIYSTSAVGHCGGLPDQTRSGPARRNWSAAKDRVAFPGGVATVVDQLAEGDRVLTC